MVSARTIAKVILVSAGVILLLYLLYLVRRVIGLLLISVFLAIALGPAVDFFQRLRVRRWLSILLVYFLIFAAIFGIGLLFVPPVVSGVNQFVDKVPTYVDDLRKNRTLRRYDDKYNITSELRKQADRLPNTVSSAAGTLRDVTVGVFSALFQLLTVLVLTFFLLLDGRRLAEWVFRELGPERGPRARALAADVYAAVGGYVVGNLLISLIAGLGAYVVLTILGVPFAIPLAVIVGLLDLIPLVGSTIAGVLVGIVAAFHDFPTALIVWAIWVIVYQQIENNVIQPVVYRRTVAMHPLIVLTAVLVGGTLLGVLGALLAIPVAAGIQIVARDVWRERQRTRAALPERTRARPDPAPEGW
ncbi:MAG: AI-2E family transporter [Thermoleophilaceae bacterium]|nr:AI-2E family transporter [Thermoleophilaceae bacterium]